MGRARLAVLLPFVLASCSPAYVARSAAGHARLTWRRRALEQAPAELRAKAEVALAARRYGLERLGLRPTRDYLTWAPVDGDAVTWLVYACPRTALEPHRFWFPFVGSFPYKGHFRKERAEAEAAAFEKKGLDAAVVPVAAYNTPLPWGDPLPAPVLRWSDGDLAELVLHELVHGTVYLRGQGGFNEAAASWVAERAVAGFLSGAALREWQEGRERGERRARLLDELKERLSALYAGPEPDKLAKRAELFSWARAQAAARRVRLREPLNNATVAAHAVYRGEPALFDALFEKHGRDWPRTLAALKSLDRRDPWGALRAAGR